MTEQGKGIEKPGIESEVSNHIFTVPNLISFIRLCLVPVFLILLFQGFNLAATLLFALAASTDWIDGQIARKTHAVSRLGQLLDPAVDRILMIAGVISLFLLGRLPLWIILLVLIRDGVLLFGAAFILKRFHIRVPVIYLGKIATTFLFVGFAGMLLYWPLLNGFGLIGVSWLPGFSGEIYSWGIWFIYLGLILGLVATLYYVIAASLKIRSRKIER